jgi:hypothetical protein
MKKSIWVFTVLLLATPAFADDIRINTDQLLQGEFNDFVGEFGMALSFNPMAPAEPLGITGFDISAEVVLTDISDNKGYWKKMVDSSDVPSYLPVPRLHVIKGLPFHFDVGAFYSAVPDSNIKLWGFEAKYAILEGSVATPALSIRGSYSQLDGVDDVDLNTQAVDLMISKGFLMLTPYGGVSALWVHGSENSELVNLKDANESLFRGIVGLQIHPFPLFVINAEASFGEVVQYGLKLALRF